MNYKPIESNLPIWKYSEIEIPKCDLIVAVEFLLSKDLIKLLYKKEPELVKLIGTKVICTARIINNSSWYSHKPMLFENIPLNNTKWSYINRNEYGDIISYRNYMKSTLTRELRYVTELKYE